MNFRKDKPFWLAVVFSCLLMFSIGLTAHITNEESLFPDIKSAEARFDVILLVSVGVIPVTQKFNPDSPLSWVDLAAWTALTEDLVEAGDNPDTGAMAREALSKGLIDSLEGNATYKDITHVLFTDMLVAEVPGTVPTRAQAAGFIAEHLTSGENGTSILDRRNMTFGPTGEVRKVESRMNPDGGTSYFITIDNETYPFYSHGKVANGPVDLNEWHERHVKRSVIHDLGQVKLWVYLEAGEAEHDHSKHEYSEHELK